MVFPFGIKYGVSNEDILQSGGVAPRILNLGTAKSHDVHLVELIWTL